MRAPSIRPLMGALCALVVVMVALGLLGSSAGRTDAAFTDDEYAAASLGVATLTAPTNLKCTGGVLSVTLTWDPPVDNASLVTSYAWSVTGLNLALGTPSSGTTGPTTANRKVTLALSVLGSGSFSVRAVSTTPAWQGSVATIPIASVAGLGC